MARTVIAAFGSELRGDDGVGLAVLRELAAVPLPADVRLVEVGTGGLALVHELIDGCERLVVIDGIACEGRPGQVRVLRPDVPDPATLSTDERARLAVDAHLAEPGRALLAARALGVLPQDVHLVGIEVHDTGDVCLELSAAVARAVPVAAARARELASGALA